MLNFFLSPEKQTAAIIERKNRKKQREENLKTVSETRGNNNSKKI